MDYLRADGPSVKHVSTIRAPTQDELAAGGGAALAGGDMTIQALSAAPVASGGGGGTPVAPGTPGVSRVACCVRGGPILMLNLRAMQVFSIHT